MSTRTPRLVFVDGTIKGYFDAFKQLVSDGIVNILFRGRPDIYTDFLRYVKQEITYAAYEIWAYPGEMNGKSHHDIRECVNDNNINTVFIFSDCGAELTSTLLEYSLRMDCTICAPITNHYYSNRPLLIQSIPKSGTHLLFQCAEELGYLPPPSLDLPSLQEKYLPGHYYNIQHMLTDYISKPYSHCCRLVDQLYNSPILFIIRDPRDVVVSMAYYLAKQKEYHVLSSYMESLSPAERIASIIIGDYPIPIYINRHFSFRGNIRDLFMKYVDWLKPMSINLLPIRFEELVGSKGGGSDEAQLKTLWKMQLALHIPGSPADYQKNIFNVNSITFRSGKINSYIDEFNDGHHNLFNLLPQDFMEIFGYADVDLISSERGVGDYSKLLTHVKENKGGWLRNGRISCRGHSLCKPTKQAYNYIYVDSCERFNILRLGDYFYAIPQDLGEIDLQFIDPDQLENLKGVIHSDSYFSIKALIESGLAMQALYELAQQLRKIQEKHQTESGYPRNCIFIGDYRGFNLVTLGGKCYGVPQALGEMDLTQMGPQQLEAKGGVLRGEGPDVVRARIDARLALERVEELSRLLAMRDDRNN